jgi:hypothetical protein
MLRILKGATIADLRSFSKAAYLLSVKGYESGKYAEITRELVDIIRLRGLYDNEPRWGPTLDIVWKAWQGENGLIAPGRSRAGRREITERRRPYQDDRFHSRGA